MKYVFWFFIVIIFIFRLLVNDTSYQENDVIRISTKINSEPIRYDDSQRLSLDGLVIYLPLFPEIHYGDEVVIEGKVNDKKLKNPQLISVTESPGFLYQIRLKIINVYQKFLPEPYSSLVAGVTLGSKSSIPAHFWEVLRSSGTAHVVVASGMNVTLVAGFLLSFLIIFLPRTKAIPLTLVGIWTYSIISGFDAPIIRAAIMGSIAFTAQVLGKLYYAWRALVFSALIMLLIQPKWINDLGFILSFVATSSLMIFEAKIRQYLVKIPRLFREGLSTSLAAQVGVAPILLVTFGQFSVMSPLINALVLWTIAPITIIGMIGGLVGVVVPNLGRLILYLLLPLAYWFTYIINNLTLNG